MKRELTISLPGYPVLDLNLHDYILFTGGNKEWSNIIVGALKRLCDSKRLTASEKDYYSDNSICFKVDGVDVNNNRVKLVSITDSISFLENFTWNKDSLLYDNVAAFSNTKEINNIIEEINELLILLTTKIEIENKLDSNQLYFDNKALTLDDLLKRNINLKFGYDYTETPIQFVNPNLLIDLFINLISDWVYNNQKEIWIVLDNISSFLSAENHYKLIEKLLEISKETKLVRLLIFDTPPKPFVNLLDLEKVVLLYDHYQQLPSLDITRASIARHYPDELVMSDEELTRRLFTVFPHIGKPDYLTSLTEKDMILLIVLKDLLDDSTIWETSQSDLTQAERNFLINRA